MTVSFVTFYVYIVPVGRRILGSHRGMIKPSRVRRTVPITLESYVSDEMVGIETVAIIRSVWFVEVQ